MGCFQRFPRGRLGLGGGHEQLSCRRGMSWRLVLRDAPERDDRKVLTSSEVADVKLERDSAPTPDESLR